ncbi:DUF2306 domain-containing protein [Psychromarinibacter halotolerans]|uniref:DUF2306 domain-containing protein n=1 Tax=Psychromarinibacter halotolerans TaxID=1775175 RepID=A0ABV7H139_9RHOB|nr:DUF2306 domain-containing protein [Psychromarinibacter halotolerans]MDF0598057.1 DUF2306 domain-containing protein [Psychromarinibacter halotolerans]
MPAFLRTRTALFWLLSFAVALVSYRWLVFGVEASMDFMLHHFIDRRAAFLAHVLFAPVALVLAPFQLARGLRARRPALHRWLGRVYGVAILISGLGGLAIAPFTSAGPVAAWAFGILAVLWMGITGRGIWLAMQRRIAEHRRWMIRSVALTFAGVTLRLELPLLMAAFGFDTGYQIVAWLCWVANLLIAEWWLRRDRARAPLAA